MIFWKKKEDFEKIELKSTLNELIDEMKSNGYNRIVINLAELPNDKPPGGWLNTTSYYPDELLNAQEISLMNSEKSYQVVSLVLGEIPEVVKYPDAGFEGIERNRLYPMLPDMKNTSPLYYQSTPYFFSLDDAVAKFQEVKMGPDELKLNFNRGVQEYKDITKKLFESAGVYDSLKKLEDRKTESDKVYDSMKLLRQPQ
jgi:hypothetical protein